MIEVEEGSTDEEESSLTSLEILEIIHFVREDSWL